MLRRTTRAALAAAAFAAWASSALPDEAAVPTAAPAVTFAELQRFLSGQAPGGGPTAPTAEHWIDPVCTGYGPGLGPRLVAVPVLDAETLAVLARSRLRRPPDSAEPEPPR